MLHRMRGSEVSVISCMERQGFSCFIIHYFFVVCKKAFPQHCTTLCSNCFIKFSFKSLVQTELNVNALILKFVEMHLHIFWLFKYCDCFCQFNLPATMQKGAQFHFLIANAGLVIVMKYSCHIGLMAKNIVQEGSLQLILSTQPAKAIVCEKPGNDLIFSSVFFFIVFFTHSKY